MVIASALLGLLTATAGPVQLAGVDWHEGMEATKSIAAKENKPFLLLHMMGRLDDAFC